MGSAGARVTSENGEWVIGCVPASTPHSARRKPLSANPIPWVLPITGGPAGTRLLNDSPRRQSGRVSQAVVIRRALVEQRRSDPYFDSTLSGVRSVPPPGAGDS